MYKVLEYVLSDFWRFLATCVFLMIVALWKPVEINVLNGYWKKPEDDEDDVD